MGGCFLSLLAIGALTWHFFPHTEHLLLMAAFGSSAILIFTMPAVPAAQPWAVVVSHTTAALVGVFVRQHVPLPHFVSLAVAVGLALLVMLLTSSLHPPAGGTAIAALNADGLLHSHGYWLAVFPVASGMIILVALAIVYLNLFTGRRYPPPRRARPAPAPHPPRNDSH